MTGGEDKEGHVVTFKTWIRNTNNTDILFFMQGKQANTTKSHIRDLWWEARGIKGEKRRHIPKYHSNR